MDIRFIIIELIEKTGLVALAALVTVLVPPLRDRLLGVGRPRTAALAVTLGVVLSMWGARMGQEWRGHYFNVHGIGVLIAAILAGPRGGLAAGLAGGSFLVLRINPDADALRIVASGLDGLLAGWVVRRRPQTFELPSGFVAAVGAQAPSYLMLIASALVAGRRAGLEATWPIHLLQLAANAAGAIVFVNVARVVLTREENAVALAEARAAADRLELAALRRRLEPHFLFNALNTLRATIRRDPAHARELVSDLADLYRYLLHHPDDAPLASEVEHAEQYLAIERARLGEGRLVIDRELPADLHHARVPALLLQPLVENAVKHGVAAHAGPGRVTLRAARSQDTLVVTVVERHSGARRGVVSGGAGIALDTLHEALAKRYAGRAQLELSIDADGSQAEVRLPLDIGNQRLTPWNATSATEENR